LTAGFLGAVLLEPGRRTREHEGQRLTKRGRHGSRVRGLFPPAIRGFGTTSQDPANINDGRTGSSCATRAHSSMNPSPNVAVSAVTSPGRRQNFE
jgi:hypothetical protein